MKFQTPLLKGYLKKRYKRFLSDIELEGEGVITAHCPNPGAMLGIKEPGTPVWVSRSPNPNRKLPYTWEIAEVEGTYVGVNTFHPNTLVEEALRAKQIPHFEYISTIKREVPYGNGSRIDFLLSEPSGKLTYVEVKNVHLKRNKKAAFPDSVTARGAKHMHELAQVVADGHDAFIIYVVQRNDCEGFELAHDIDPHYGKEAHKAFQAGVTPLVYACEVTPDEVKLSHPLKYEYKDDAPI